MQKIITSCILFLFASFSGFCQILDDSTKLVYSAKTSLSFTQNSIENNTNQKNTIDTSLFHIHNYQYFYKNGILYQDLGNFGTPLNRIYYDAPTSIGKTIGLNTLIDYSYDINTTNYYDTKSPYTKLNYIQGSKGLQIMEVLHTQNIKPNWNVGFSFKRMVANKIIGVSTRQEKQSSNYSFVAHTSYFSKNNRYKFLFNVNLFQHQQYENGGIFLDSTETKASMFDYQLEKVQLYSLPRSTSNKKNLRSYDRRSNFRFYNEYALIEGKGIQLFHQFDYQTNFIRYDDDFLYNKVALYENIDYYPNTYYDTLATNDRIVHELYENKIGVKGSANKLFYKGYYRLKNFQYRQEKYENFVAKYTENFVGGNLEYRFSDTTILAAKAEYYLGRDYLFQADFYSKFLDVCYNRTYYSPTLFQMHNYSNNYRWSNNFNNTLSDLVYVKGKLNIGNLRFHPWVSYNKVENLIYNDNQSNPTQSGSVIEFLSAGLIGKINWRSIYFEDQVRYTKTTGADIWRVPELFNKASLYLYGPLFKKALRIQMGVDMTWKSGYYANAYAPGSNQFHLSDKTNDFNFVDAYMIADVYLNAQIKRAFIFLKMTHVNMNLPAAGYQITPYYTGMPRTFQFGVKWLFYD